ncbi:hypothetical protein NW767_015530 [Fusarium falciforme]|nr:hypothetical protein NW767_015530 [Fusarium falciforme]
MISYLGFVETKQHGEISGFVLYFEYCELGDLETMHVKREMQAPLDDDERQQLKELGLLSAGARSPDKPEPKPLSESDVWTLMYQLFAALAYLHYGVSISSQGDCRIEPHWDPHLHRDIKPHNGMYIR